MLPSIQRYIKKLDEQPEQVVVYGNLTTMRKQLEGQIPHHILNLMTVDDIVLYIIREGVTQQDTMCGYKVIEYKIPKVAMYVVCTDEGMRFILGL